MRQPSLDPHALIRSRTCWVAMRLRKYVVGQRLKKRAVQRDNAQRPGTEVREGFRRTSNFERIKRKDKVQPGQIN